MRVKTGSPVVDTRLPHRRGRRSQQPSGSPGHGASTASRPSHQSNSCHMDFLPTQSRVSRESICTVAGLNTSDLFQPPRRLASRPADHGSPRLDWARRTHCVATRDDRRGTGHGAGSGGDDGQPGAARGRPSSSNVGEGSWVSSRKRASASGNRSRARHARPHA